MAWELWHRSQHMIVLRCLRKYFGQRTFRRLEETCYSGFKPNNSRSLSWLSKTGCFRRSRNKGSNLLGIVVSSRQICCTPTFKNKAGKSELRRLFQLAKPERWRLTGAILLLVVSSTVTMALPFCMGRILDIIYTTSGEEMRDRLVIICQTLIAVFLLGAIANFGRSYLMNISGQHIINRLRTKLYDSILHQEVSFFDQMKTGELVNRLSADASVVGLSVTMNISDGLRSTFAVLAGMGMMAYTSPKLALIGLSIVPPVAFAAVFYGRYVRNITKSLQDSLAQATQLAEEHIANIRTVRAFAQEDHESKNYKSQINSILGLASKESVAKAVFFGCAGLSGNMVVLTVLYYGGLMMSQSQITVGDLTSFLMYAAYVGISIGGLSSFYSETMRALGASTRIWELIDRHPSIPISGGLVPSELRGHIRFEDVTFSYPNRPESPVVCNLSLSVPPGAVMAVVGASGSGKSTLASLLLRFYDPSQGKIWLDSHEVTGLDPSWLRRNVGLVSQDPVLFSGTIRENVLYGSSEDTMLVPEESLLTAIKQANALEFVQQFPLGLDTLVGERGVMLSGGQRQRLTIARALIKNPKILILDEATSSLDAHSEHLVQEALERLMHGRTVITIAHRLSTILQANQIAVLDKGELVELGSYQQLMALPDGKFKALVQKQTLKS